MEDQCQGPIQEMRVEGKDHKKGNPKRNEKSEMPQRCLQGDHLLGSKSQDLSCGLLELGGDQPFEETCPTTRPFFDLIKEKKRVGDVVPQVREMSPPAPWLSRSWEGLRKSAITRKYRTKARKTKDGPKAIDERTGKGTTLSTPGQRGPPRRTTIKPEARRRRNSRAERS